MDDRPFATSGSNRPLLQSATLGVPVVPQQRLRTRNIVLGALALFFVLVGLLNILSSLFAPEVEANPVPSAVTEGFSGIVPERLTIPVLGIDARVEHVGVNAWGNMAVPSSYTTVAWYSLGALPGAEGNAVIAGHLDNSLGLAGIFENLHRLRLGDSIVVKDGAGVSRQFTVTEMTVYDADAAPQDKVFSSSGDSKLVLITCNGAWDHNRKTYDKRLVVTAKLSD